jgi:hypothetical protein
MRGELKRVRQSSNQPCLIATFILFCGLITSCASRGTVEFGEGGKIVRGEGIAQCGAPRKPYAKEVDAELKLELKDLDLTADAALKDKVIKLTDYSQKGLDLDLLLFRICEMSINRGFTNEQTSQLIQKVITLWNQEEQDKRFRKTSEAPVFILFEGSSQKVTGTVRPTQPGTYELDEDLLVGACVMRKGSKLEFHQGGQASYVLFIKTIQTTNRDIWHQLWLLDDGQTFGEYDGPELHMGDGFTRWEGRFAYKGAIPNSLITWRSRC